MPQSKKWGQNHGNAFSDATTKAQQETQDANQRIRTNMYARSKEGHDRATAETAKKIEASKNAGPLEKAANYVKAKSSKRMKAQTDRQIKKNNK